MQIVKHKPVTRGVTELMYVGDDDAVEKATPAISPARIMVGAVGISLALFAPKKWLRALGAGLATDIAVTYLLDKTP